MNNTHCYEIHEETRFSDTVIRNGVPDELKNRLQLEIGQKKKKKSTKQRLRIKVVQRKRTPSGREDSGRF